MSIRLREAKNTVVVIKRALVFICPCLKCLRSYKQVIAKNYYTVGKDPLPYISCIDKLVNFSLTSNK